MILKAVVDLMKKVERLEAHIKPYKADKLLTYDQAAKVLNLTTEGLKSRVKRGQIDKTMNGNKSGVLASEITRYLKQQNNKDIRL